VVTGPDEAGVAFSDRPGVRNMIRLDSVSKRFPDGTVAVADLTRRPETTRELRSFGVRRSVRTVPDPVVLETPTTERGRRNR
jgi:hypothetical protein